jgi:hypothetical protein
MSLADARLCLVGAALTSKGAARAAVIVAKRIVDYKMCVYVKG